MDFTGQVAVITGGASGMGAATAEAFVAAGGSVVLIDLNEPLLKEMADGLARATPVVGDVSDSAFCNRVIARTVELNGKVDVLVNAAGIILRADTLTTTDAGWQKMMNVNVNGTFFMCRAAIEVMKAQGKGAIVNFGSIWGDVGAAGVVAYCASKGAVHNMTRAMALEYVEEGVRVNAVCPGEVDTPMLRSGRERPPTEEDMQRLADTVPMKRLASPAEIAQVVCFLASDSASYMTGAMVPVDAGYTAR